MGGHPDHSSPHPAVRLPGRGRGRPHATLVGNLNIAGDEDSLINTLIPLLAATRPFVVYNHGIRADGRRSVRYDIDGDALGQNRNPELTAVAEGLRAAAAPLHVPHEDYLAPNVADYRFGGHLSLGSFDLEVRPDTLDEVLDFVRGLRVHPPRSFSARWFSLFRLEADWTGHWWNTMTWTHLTSWDIAR